MERQQPIHLKEWGTAELGLEVLYSIPSLWLFHQNTLFHLFSFLPCALCFEDWINQKMLLFWDSWILMEWVVSSWPKALAAPGKLQLPVSLRPDHLPPEQVEQKQHLDTEESRTEMDSWKGVSEGSRAVYYISRVYVWCILLFSCPPLPRTLFYSL